MVKFTGLYVLGDNTIKVEYLHIDYPDTFVLYIIKSSIGVKSSHKTRSSMEANRWWKWDDNFLNDKTRRISRLVRVLGIDSSEEVLGSKVTLAMLRPLRFQRLRLARLKKPGRKDR